MRNSSSLDWLRFMHTPNDYRVSQILSEFINSLFSPYRDTCNKYKQKRMQSSQITPFEIS